MANEKTTVVIRRDALTPDYACQPHIPTKEAAMELTYSLCGDYLIPNLALEDTKEYHIGKYGRMRCAYLKNHRPALYSSLLLTEKLLPHLAEVDAACALILSLLFQESGENDHRLSVGGAALRVQGGGTGAADESHCVSVAIFIHSPENYR